MLTRTRFISLLALLLLFAVPLAGCAKKEVKKGKVVVKDCKFVLSRDSDQVFGANAVGTVENVGQYAVKNIVITGYCHSCQLKWLEGKWFTNGSDVPSSKDYEARISYLPKGGKAEFTIKDIAMMMHKDNATTVPLPEKMEVRILSFETVQD